MNALGPLRRAVIREGVLPHLALPRLMRKDGEHNLPLPRLPGMDFVADLLPGRR